MELFIEAGFDLLPDDPRASREARRNRLLVTEPNTGYIIGLYQHGGGRVELRCVHKVQRKRTPHAVLAAWAADLNERLWAKFGLDEDGDLFVKCFYPTEGGLYAPQFMRMVRAFAGLNRFVAEDCDPGRYLRPEETGESDV